MTIEMTPHMMPNIVRKLRSLFVRRFSIDCLSASCIWLGFEPALVGKHDLVAFLEPFEHLRAGAVADAKRDRHRATAGARASIRHVDRCETLRVVADGGL